tara:strand:+ start:4107 stop:5573 length:1467 start_codon:yes stop_codon:yes gene_type:complete
VKEVLEKVRRFCERYGVYLALLAFVALFVAGLRVLDEADGGLLQLRSSRSDFEDYYSASVRMSEHGDLYNMEAIRSMENTKDPGIDVNNPMELLQFSMTPEGQAYLQSLKGAGSYLYLPFFAFLLLPLSLIGYEVAVMVFQLSSIFLLWYFFVLIRKHHESMDRQRFWYIAFLSMLPVASFLSENSANANVGFLLIFLAGAGLLLASPDLAGGEVESTARSRWSYLGGALLGIAAVIKIMPAILGLFLLGRRNFRAIGAAIATGLLCLIVPVLYAGWSLNLQWHLDWYDLMINTYSQYGVVRPYANNQTISAAFSKLFVAGSDPEKQAAAGLPILFHSLEDLGSGGAFWLRTVIKSIVYSLVGTVTVLAFIFSFRRKFLRPDKRLARVYFIQALILVSLLISGVSWFHAYSLLLIPLAFRLAGSEPVTVEEKWMIGLIAFSGLGNFIFSGTVRDLLAMYSVHNWLMFILCIWSIVFTLRTMRQETEYV